MKNYYAILEVPVGCGVAEINQAYRRLVQEIGDNPAVSADLNEAHEVLTTPARRADYDRAVWGEAAATGSADSATLLPGATLLPSVPPDAAGGAGRCPMGAEARCPVLLGAVGPADTYCPECGYLLAGLNAAAGFDQTDAADADGYAWLEEPNGRSHRLRPGLNTVGRESADVLLPDKTVSRQHARLEVGDDGAVTVEDLSSTNGTQAGGEVLVPHTPRTLQADDQVRFGSVVTVLHLPSGMVPGLGAAPPAPNAGGAGSGETSSPTPPELGAGGRSSGAAARAQVVETREEGGRTYPLAPGVTTFGRRAENSVILQGDPYVSGSHAQILADGDVFVLTDTGSTNGTLLNGRRLAINEPETLSEGDVILIGGTAMRFERLGIADEAVSEEAPPVEGAETEGAETEGAETGREDAPAEPRARTSPEYNVADDYEDDGIPTRAAPTHDAPTHDTQMHDSPT